MKKLAVWYVAGLLMAVVIFQPAMVYYVFNKFKDTLVVSGLVVLSLAFLYLHHERVRKAWLLWPWLIYLLYNLPSALFLLARGEIPYTWITWALAPGVFYLMVVETGKFPQATLYYRRSLAFLAVGQALAAMGVLFPLIGTDWFSSVSAGAVFNVELIRSNIWRVAEEGFEALENPLLLFINGTFEHSANLALFSSMALFLIWLLIKNDPNTFLRRFYSIEIIFLLVVIILTFSRGAWLGLALALICLAPFQKTARRWLLGLTLMMTALLIFFPLARTMIVERIQSEGTVIDRFVNYANALSVWNESPIWGVGFGHYNQELSQIGGQEVINPHNDFLLHLAEGGVVGLLIYLSIFWTFIYKAWRSKIAIRLSQESENILFSGLAILICYLVFVLTSPGQSMLSILFILMAIWEIDLKHEYF